MARAAAVGPRRRSGAVRGGRGERWERAELALLRGLEHHGIRDLYRALHGYERQEPSWTYPRRRGGYRLDHLIGSAHFAASDCRYLHDAREAGLSDHSPLLANLCFQAAGWGSSNGPEP